MDSGHLAAVRKCQPGLDSAAADAVEFLASAAVADVGAVVVPAVALGGKHRRLPEVRMIHHSYATDIHPTEEKVLVVAPSADSSAGSADAWLFVQLCLPDGPVPTTIHMTDIPRKIAADLIPRTALVAKG